MEWKQLQKDFSELYIGEDSGKLMKEYYRKKYKDMLVIMVIGMGVILLCAIGDIRSSRLEQENIVFRNETTEDILLQMKGEEEKWEEISIRLYPKEYSKEELEILFAEACETLPELIQKEGKNESPVMSDLNLVEEIEGFPFLICWESSVPEVMDEKGNLSLANEGYDGIVKLKATFEYGDWKKDYDISVHVVTTKTADFSLLLKEELDKREAETRNDSEFFLPEYFGGSQLQWRYPKKKSALLLGILFFITIPVIAWQKDRDIHRMAVKRKEQLQEAFPEFVAKLVLLLEAGVSSRNAMFYISEDYGRKCGAGKNYLREELFYVCTQIKNGLSEKEAYELLAKRCNLSCYKKLSGTLIQHMRKGGNSILHELRSESLRAGEEEKRRMQKKGEEMGTKLLIPMMLLLGIVMIFIMVPALFSFQV